MNDFLRPCNCVAPSESDCDKCIDEVSPSVCKKQAGSSEVLPPWLAIGPAVSFLTPCLCHYSEYLLLCYNEDTNSKMQLSDIRLEERLSEYLSSRWLHSPARFAQAMGYALALSGGTSLVLEGVNSALFREYCKKKIWEHCVKHRFLTDPADEAEFLGYCGIK